MLTIEKLSRRPETFRRLTDTEVGHFCEIEEQIRPLREEHGDNFVEGAREHSQHGHENRLPAMLIYCRCCITFEFPVFFF